jgi:hypothetical protein
MNELAVTLPPSEVAPPPVPKGEREYQAFLRLLPELLQTHRGEYAAIHEGRVVATGPDQIELAIRVWGQVGYVPLHVGLITEQAPAPTRFRHYRERHSGQP